MSDAGGSGDPARLAEALARLGERKLTWPELCERAGVEHAIADPLWRALGFPDVPSDQSAYTDEDVRAAIRFFSAMENRALYHYNDPSLAESSG